ncbi:ATP-dependent Clp protease proteolytic subunit [Candidatus Saccharibacteria bacterium]|nr:ATP-dependent Clp protease proteolytic subunit [Candidatus Saccharibacteria bacterium]
MPFEIKENEVKVTCTISEKRRVHDIGKRRLYLYGEITDVDAEEGFIACSSKTGELVECIFDYNRADQGKDIESREPIRLYINSPGGDQNEGFALVDAIILSKTPVYTINVGQWSSMSFLIGIAGHKRFSFPHATFLLHDGSSGAFGSTNKVQDRVKFEERFENEVVKAHVLAHSNMKGPEYDALARVEYYLLPEDALDRGFIDEIVTDIDAIL